MPARTPGSRYASGRRQYAARNPSVQSWGTSSRLDPYRMRRTPLRGAAERGHDRRDGGAAVVVERPDLGEVLRQPEPAPDVEVEVEHDLTARHPA